MRRAGLLVAVLLLLAGAAPAGPVDPVRVRPFPLGPYASRTFVVEFKKAERANVIVIGNGQSPLGLYVFDPHGNCIARDDRPVGNSIDDNAVIWFPSATQRYRVEVRNLGPVENTVKIAIR